MQQVQALRSQTANIFVDQLDHTLVEIHNFQVAYSSVAPASIGVGVKIVGGVLTSAGSRHYGRTNLFAGSGGANHLTFDISKGATVLVRDAWYEGQQPATYAQVSDDSNVTFEGSRLATSGGSSVPGPMVPPAIGLTNFQGKASIFSSALDSEIRLDQKSDGMVWSTGNNFGVASSFFTSVSDKEKTKFDLNRKYVASYGSQAIEDRNPLPNANFVREMLAQSRAAHPSEIKDLISEITDVRMYRIAVELGSVGIHLTR
jgi:hypothetical protein